MAFTTATLLIILVFAGIPLQFAAGRPEVANVVGTMHGFLYLVYLYTAFALTRALAVKRGQMALVLLAGTVPFCAFVAERKMTRRFEALAGGTPLVEVSPQPSSLKLRAQSLKRRWISRRAMLLHLEVLVIAPACLLAAWWQATRALSGNGLSWVYSIEWPVFAIIAVAAWWHLVHEDPEVYRARKRRTGDDRGTVVLDPAEEQAAVPPVESPLGIEPFTARSATALAVLVAFEFVLGVATSFSVPFNRASASLPPTGTTVYIAHAVVGLFLGVVAVVLVVQVWHQERTAHLTAWLGLAGVGLAGAGGLLTEAQSLARFFGMMFMFVGAAVAGFSYLIPAMLKRSRQASAVSNA
jgi:integral membrane protein